MPGVVTSPDNNLEAHRLGNVRDRQHAIDTLGQRDSLAEIPGDFNYQYQYPDPGQMSDGIFAQPNDQYGPPGGLMGDQVEVNGTWPRDYGLAPQEVARQHYAQQQRVRQQQAQQARQQAEQRAQEARLQLAQSQNRRDLDTGYGQAIAGFNTDLMRPEQSSQGMVAQQPSLTGTSYRNDGLNQSPLGYQTQPQPQPSQAGYYPTDFNHGTASTGPDFERPQYGYQEGFGSQRVHYDAGVGQSFGMQTQNHPQQYPQGSPQQFAAPASSQTAYGNPYMHQDMLRPQGWVASHGLVQDVLGYQPEQNTAQQPYVPSGLGNNASQTQRPFGTQPLPALLPRPVLPAIGTAPGPGFGVIVPTRYFNKPACDECRDARANDTCEDIGGHACGRCQQRGLQCTFIKVTRKHKGWACDQCYEGKVKCERVGEGPCVNCAVHNWECTNVRQMKSGRRESTEK